MENKEIAFGVAQRFIEMEKEIRSLRIVIHKSWTHDTDSEAFVQKGIEQLQAREISDRGIHYLQSAFDVATDDDALFRTLYDQTLGKAKVG